MSSTASPTLCCQDARFLSSANSRSCFSQLVCTESCKGQETLWWNGDRKQLVWLVWSKYSTTSTTPWPSSFRKRFPFLSATTCPKFQIPAWPIKTRLEQPSEMISVVDVQFHDLAFRAGPSSSGVWLRAHRSQGGVSSSSKGSSVTGPQNRHCISSKRHDSAWQVLSCWTWLFDQVIPAVDNGFGPAVQALKWWDWHWFGIC